MQKKTFFTELQKELMDNYLENQFELYDELQERAFTLLVNTKYGTEREHRIRRLYNSLVGKRWAYARLRYKVFTL